MMTVTVMAALPYPGSPPQMATEMVMATVPCAGPPRPVYVPGASRAHQERPWE